MENNATGEKAVCGKWGSDGSRSTASHAGKDDDAICVSFLIHWQW
jgi:hypothetical protein